MPFAVTDKVTGHVKRWGTNLDCSIDPGFNINTETNTEVPNLGLLKTISRYEVKVVGGVLVEMTQVEKDAVFNTITLPKYKLQRYLEIDARTNELILNGFEFPPNSGYVFSLSSAGQSNLLGSYISRNEPAFVYPIVWPTKLDDFEFSIPNAATLEAFYLTALGTIRVHRDSGTALKDGIRVATNKAGVDAVIDSR